MYRLIALLFLAGCVAKPPVTTGFRNPAAPIYSNAVLDNARLAGRWQQVANFAPDTASCAQGGAEISGTPAGLTIAARLCLGGRETRFSGPLPATGPGRFAPNGSAEWWVIWADTNYRTLAIGTPSGAFGFILNRGADLPADRLRAAREVLDFNGYDVTKLR